MKRGQAWLLFIVFFVAVCALTMFFASAFDDDAAQQAKEETFAKKTLVELPKLTPMKNTVFITHYLPEANKRNIRTFSGWLNFRNTTIIPAVLDEIRVIPAESVEMLKVTYCFFYFYFQVQS